MRPLVILRPEPAASRTAERARQLGLATSVLPLFAARAVAWEPPEAARFDALLLTSANAVRLAGERLADYRGLPAYAVGRATAGALEAAGFTDVTAGERDANAIAARIAADGRRAVLHLGGRTVAAMEAGGLQVERVIVYEMVRMQDDGLACRLEAGSVLLVHSPRAGELLAERIPLPRRAALHLIAISPAALRACGGGWASAETPDRPDDDRMLALATRLCE